MSVSCRLCWVLFIHSHWLGCRLWGGELKGSCSRSGLLSLGHSRHPTSCHRGRGERMGQVHRLPAFLLVSLLCGWNMRSLFEELHIRYISCDTVPASHSLSPQQKLTNTNILFSSYSLTIIYCSNLDCTYCLQKCLDIF